MSNQKTRTLAAMAIMSAVASTMPVYADGPTGNRDVSRPSTLSKVAQLSRKRKNQKAKKARKMNRR